LNFRGEGDMVARSRPYTWLTVALRVLALLLHSIWGGCEKSPVSSGDNPTHVPITSDVKWQVVFSDSRAKFGFRPKLAFDSSGTFGLVGISGSWFRTVDGGHSWFFSEAPATEEHVKIMSATVAFAWRPPLRTEDG